MSTPDISDKYPEDEFSSEGIFEKDGRILVITDPNNIISLSEGPKLKAKGGRVELRGGGICKKGMNKKAIGKNS